ncbi:mucin-15 [Nycticebus coucang]|uniref:mucin-15 n=1 Tax=Nycticebus coucang TaxID=9470 RepID=UPI00234D23D1|nr:mucin-15 [Nycticebus coucang]
MLTLVRILLISTLFSSLLFGSHGKENPEINTTQSVIESLKTVGNQPISLASEANLNPNEEKMNSSNPIASHSSLLDLSSDIHAMKNFSSNLSTETFSGTPRPTSMFSTTPVLIHGYVSKLPWNASITDTNPLLVSYPSTTPTVPLENFTWSLANDTTKPPDNSSSTVGLLPPEPTTKSVTPSTVEHTGWLTTDRESFTGFTPHQEKTTLQPTLKFTNNSKLFPNTSDPQKENRSTGIVFGAILGAILGASLLTLVGYLLCGKRKMDSFSHRRLYDDRNEPVLRLDNAPEPYDVSFGNSSYYNPAGNDSSTPEGQENARDSIPMDDVPPLRTSV